MAPYPWGPAGDWDDQEPEVTVICHCGGQGCRDCDGRGEVPCVPSSREEDDDGEADLSIGTPVLGIIEKAMDIWLAVYQAAPQEEKAELARQIIQRPIVWGFANRIMERMLDGKEES